MKRDILQAVVLFLFAVWQEAVYSLKFLNDQYNSFYLFSKDFSLAWLINDVENACK